VFRNSKTKSTVTKPNTKRKTLNQVERIAALLRAAPVVRMMRDGGTSWEDLATKMRKNANPLGLTPRQLSRIYEGPDAYRWSVLKSALHHAETETDNRQAQKTLARVAGPDSD